MEFPAFRSAEWMASAFARAAPAASLAADSAERPRELGEKPTDKDRPPSPVPPLVPPSFCFRNFDPVPAYLASFPTAGLYMQRVQQVKWTIKRALFRQCLFKIQNVEVLEMKRCKRPRRLVSSDIRYDAESERRASLAPSSLSRASLDETPVAAFSSAQPAAARASDSSPIALPSLPSLPTAASSSVSERLRRWRRDAQRDEETLREEIWKVDRCGSLREYRIIISRDRATKDFFSVSVQPVAWSDWLRQKYFNFFDKTVDAEE
ncbi:conserved hypothetical protein [Neospora caninum Liverpool]|uniref:Uncharacterized protein n=1 Tax=Neospora caninum (strain Liverpool) TaxID=572307 RepID=F0VLJ0_NEOCL|nr:conserved hypothetical protein [Neospora caninum Liverpool]CBZ54118.1 conserved hypothetical protein [Neospora caninum Liverpool]CEL68817.1 TPA: hypothetical protein BN1204_045510 [Neospora caninum Liverpool]|eukprot:XP_003884149.1 conserved hypothetical protein [Neospora caninum Liverpool]